MAAGNAEQEQVKLLEGLFDQPTLAMQQLDFSTGFANFVVMDERSYAATSFLDHRAVTAREGGFNIPIGHLTELLEKQQPPQRPADFLFHMGHSGAALISRQLGTLPGHFALREPEPMRRLAKSRRLLAMGQSQVDWRVWERCVPLVNQLIARTFDPSERAVIKPSATADYLMPIWLSAHPDDRAVFVYIDPETFLAETLQPHWRDQTLRHADAFMSQDMEQMTGMSVDVSAMDEGERCAMMWLVLAVRFDQMMSHPDFAARCRRVNFDAYLADPVRHLGEVSAFFGGKTDLVRIQRAATGPISRVHCRKPDNPYTAEDRSQMLNASLRANASLVRSGLSWLEKQFKAHPELERALAWRERPRAEA